jgi:hypothetical protein
VATDLARYVNPGIGDGKVLAGGPEPAGVAFGVPDKSGRQSFATAAQADARNLLAGPYDGTQARVADNKILLTYQRVFSVPGALLALAVLLTIAGMALARGPLRIGAWVFGLTGIALLVGPTATFTYDFRYSIPPTALLVTAALISGYGLYLRFGDRLPTAQPRD